MARPGTANPTALGSGAGGTNPPLHPWVEAEVEEEILGIDLRRVPAVVPENYLLCGLKGFHPELPRGRAAVQGPQVGDQPTFVEGLGNGKNGHPGPCVLLLPLRQRTNHFQVEEAVQLSIDLPASCLLRRGRNTVEGYVHTLLDGL